MLESSVAPSAPTPEVLAAVEAEFTPELASASDGDTLQKIRSKYFGPNGRVTTLLRSVGQLPPEQRREAGQATNQLRQKLESQLTQAIDRFESSQRERELR